MFYWCLFFAKIIGAFNCICQNLRKLLYRVELVRLVRFVGVDAHTCISIYICIVFLKKEEFGKKICQYCQPNGLQYILARNLFW
jgi:hypothetical protein